MLKLIQFHRKNSALSKHIPPNTFKQAEKKDMSIRRKNVYTLIVLPFH
jgi:hypothetical protein